MFKAMRAVQAFLSLYPCDLFEGGKLSEEVPLWLRRASKHFGAWGHIRHYACLRSNLCTLTDPNMASHTGLSPDADKILKHGGTRNADLSDNDTTSAEDHVVADLH